MDTTADNQAAAATPRRRVGLAWAALLLAFAGPVAHTLLLEQPFLRSSGLPVWLLLVPAVILAVLAFADQRWRTRIPAALAVALAGIYTLAFFFMMGVPAPRSTQLADGLAKDFTLPDHQGRPISLSETYAAGPVLLVFYRGHW